MGETPVQWRRPSWEEGRLNHDVRQSQPQWRRRVHATLALAWVTVALTLSVAATVASAQAPASPPDPPPEPRYKFSGLVFGDFYQFSQNHDPAWEGQAGFWLRRIYATFDYAFAPRLSTRLRLEMNSNGQLGDERITPYVKDAYLRWTYFGRQQLTLGIEPSLSIEFVESVWGLRHVEKTPLDLYKWDSSRDTGLTLSGPLNDAGTLSYGVQSGTEQSDYAELKRLRDVRVAARYDAKPGLAVEGMLAWLGRDLVTSRLTAHVFAGYRAASARAGFLYSRQARHAAEGPAGPDLALDVYSGFAVADLKPKKVSVFARVDRHGDPCPDCSNIDYLPISTDAPFTLVVTGVEYYIHPSVRFSPNVEWVHYSAPADSAIAQPKDDLVWRATFYWAW